MTRPARLRRAECPHCHQPIAWGTLQNGRNRSFDADPRPLHQIAPADAYAYSRRHQAMICLDGEPHPPAAALQAHYCAAYRDAKLLANIDQIGDLTDDVIPTPPTTPRQQRR